MDSKEVFLKELKVNKSVFDSSTNSDERAAVFRKQLIILDQITQSSSESERITLRRSQFEEYNLGNSSEYRTFIKERSNDVEKRFCGMSRSSSRAAQFAKEFLCKNKSSSLEPECSGKYTSCACDEVNSDDLKMFHNVLGVHPSSAQLIESPTRKVAMPKSDVNKSQRESASKIAAPGRQLGMNPFLTSISTSHQSSLQIPGFRTAREELIIQNVKKNGEVGSSSRALFNYGASKKSLGARRNVRSGFVPPIRQEDNSGICTPPDASDASSTEHTDERLRNIDAKMVELISNEIMHKYKAVGWEDIAGLEYAKATIKEAVVWPLLRPDIFTGLRRPPRGILLFGPPGTGKTLIGKCIASQSKSTFFSISASSLTSKWIGDGEKMVRALFAVAAIHQPSVVFIDEIDSLLSQRSETEHESSRRLKTEFLVQLDGANTTDEERILIVGATNRPQELDEAARRRLVRRLYIPLPELTARIQILTNLLRTVRNSITKEEICEIGNQTGGYSGADMETLCREASMEPIRSIPSDEIESFIEENVRPVLLEDFHSALRRVRASVSQTDLQQYTNWNRLYGAGH